VQHGDVSRLRQNSKENPKSELEEEATKKWENEWEQCKKASELKQYFPNVLERIKLSLNVISNFTAIVTGRGKIKEYVHTFKITESAKCLCKKEDHIL